MISKLLYTLFDYRYIYCFRLDRAYKIGISNNWQRRKKEIERKLGTKVYYKFAFKVFRAHKIEQSFHRKYRSRRISFYAINGKAVNLGREWFCLQKVHFYSLKGLLFIRSVFSKMVLFLTSVLLLLLFVLLIYKLLQ